MTNVLIFAGTTEGRGLAEFLSRQRVTAHVCVATEYGETLMREGEFLKIHAGRLDTEEIAALIRELDAACVVDATHPYAVVVSENIQKACELAGREYLRLLRETGEHDTEDCIRVDSVEEAVTFLAGTEGKILAATGSKELAKYTALPDYQERVTARVLSTPEVAAACAGLGFQGKNLICMQGPFSEELNTALLRQTGAAWLVTKEAGREGGFEEKLRSARKAGAKVVLIGRPKERTKGHTALGVRRILCEKLNLKPRRQITLAGIGMGSREGMTLEVKQACREAQLLIGADRMLKAAEEFGKPVLKAYQTEVIRDYVCHHPEYEKITILLSGDIGFYSGAKKLLEAFEGEDIQVCCGISSVVYLCGKLHTSWEDVKLVSLHGRRANLVGIVQRNAKVFALIGEKDGVNRLCRKFIDYGMTDLEISVGEQLSYPEEKITTGTPEMLVNQWFDPLCVVLIQNPSPAEVVTHGLEDEAFLRDKVPMTKSEVRSISISKLHLTEDAVVYDVGAGTGSVSIEMALQAVNGQVFAIEKKEEAVALLEKNKRKFAADNLEIIQGLAPEALEELPAPTHAFIGGSSGNLKEILEVILAKNPQARIVINAIALETVAEALNCLKELKVTDTDIASVSVGKSREIGRYHMMMGQNPVFVISCTGGEG
ncbi:MAG: precorrin-6A reductase [Candidatus Limivivens sp.]|nr:precorrin-6A reductase [Candidatus Limivivens sp.]